MSVASLIILSHIEKCTSTAVADFCAVSGAHCYFSEEASTFSEVIDGSCSAVSIENSQGQR